MTWKTYACLLLLPALTGGCGANLAEVGRPPSMSAIGDGVQPVAYSVPGVSPRRSTSYHSLWDANADLYRDPRATKAGDVITVVISMQDKAKLDNKTDRSRDSQTKAGFDYLSDLAIFQSKGAVNADVNSQSSTKGAGKIDRAEEIKLSIAAMVTEVLPNGNLLIGGSQEVRVNYEMRVLNVAGIVRPRDISRGNTISYEKIAEARISYGGRGRLMEVQQPGWGHQIYDQVGPF
jgi:flagellar L-ring protein FlgH